MAQAVSDQWFADWFNQDYLKLYAHRNTEEASSVVDLIGRCLPGFAGGRTLDLGCGAGRHLRYLARMQKAIGLDLSPWLLGVAREKNPDAPLSRGDMRALPFRDGSFNLVVSLFTSFGYFREDAENAHVLGEVARVTEPGGWLVLDFLNARETRRALVPFERRQIGGQWVRQVRRISETGHFVLKTIRMEGSGGEFHERVRLFEPVELASMLISEGFDVRSLYGDYAGRPWNDYSPRAIVVARKRSEH